MRRRALLATLTLPALAHSLTPHTARLLAERYPVNAPLSYVSALIWSAQRRLGGTLTLRSQQAVAALRQAAPTTPPADWPARRHSWLAAGTADATIARAWTGMQSRIDADGGFTDVCAGTPAGPTLDFYLQRPIVRGRDDRAAAMALWAAIAIHPAAR